MKWARGKCCGSMNLWRANQNQYCHATKDGGNVLFDYNYRVLILYHRDYNLCVKLASP